MFFTTAASDLFDTFKEPDGTLTQQGFSELLTDLLLVSDFRFLLIAEILSFQFSLINQKVTINAL